MAQHLTHLFRGLLGRFDVADRPVLLTSLVGLIAVASAGYLGWLA